MSEGQREVMEGDILERTDVPGPDKTDPKFDFYPGRNFGVRKVNEGHIVVDLIPDNPRVASEKMSIPSKYLKGPWLKNKGGEGNPPVKGPKP